MSNIDVVGLFLSILSFLGMVVALVIVFKKRSKNN